MEYDIIEKKNKLEMASTVAAYIKAGWVCQGGVAISSPSPMRSEVIYCQAMVRTRP